MTDVKVYVLGVRGTIHHKNGDTQRFWINGKGIKYYKRKGDGSKK